ncbi:MAG: four helix bundle protein [Thermomicrobiales bacterium]
MAWQRAMDLIVRVYEISRDWPIEERYGLTQQTRRSALSIASNIAEGHGRRSDKEFSRFLAIAHGSLLEMETQLEVSSRLGYATRDDIGEFFESSGEVGRLIQGLRRTLAADST